MTGYPRPADAQADPPISSSSSSGGGGGDVGERLARIETTLEHVATRESVADMKTLIERKESTMLRWLLGILATAAIALVVALIRSFSD